MDRLGEKNINEPVRRHARGDYTTLRIGQSVGEALEELRRQTLAEKIIYFYVIDDAGKLVGVVPTRRLLMSAAETRIDQIMVNKVISVPETMSVLEACEFFVMYRLLAFPVVDGENRLVGVIDVGLFTDEIFGVTERESAQDVFQMIGIHLALAKQGSALAGFKDRFPWLLCNIGGGIACAFISGMYEQFLGTAIILALFVPVVLTLSEGVSIQSMTITLQQLREGPVHWRRLLRALRREFLTALMLGAGSGALVGLVVLAWKRSGAAALAIGMSIWAAVVTACLLGVILPTMIRALKGDPKIAAGPVVLACADVVTLLFYFNMAGWILG